MTKDISALVGSRICHDLISPIGAIGNGVELLAMTDGGDTSAEMALITQSVENANARIRFFRVAFGKAKADNAVSQAETIAVLDAIANGGRHTFDWQIHGDSSRSNVRIAFLLILCMETALPTGGNVTISKDGETWLVAAESSRIQVEKPLWDGLVGKGEAPDHSAAQVQFAMLPPLIAASERDLSVQFYDGRIVARF